MEGSVRDIDDRYRVYTRTEIYIYVCVRVVENGMDKRSGVELKERFSVM